MNKPNVIHLHDLTVTYQRHPAIHHVSGDFAAGSMTAIVGPNGAGKSTLLKAIMGDIATFEGRIEHEGATAHTYGYLPQAKNLDRQFPLTVADVVMMGAWQYLGVGWGMSPTLAEQAARALARVGMDGFQKNRISALSVGQFQRVLFARLLLQDAKVMILDEPFNAMDAQTRSDLLAIIKDWHSQGRTIIAVLHDLKQVSDNFPETLLLAREVVAWGATKNVLTTQNLLRAQGLSNDLAHINDVCKV